MVCRFGMVLTMQGNIRSADDRVLVTEHEHHRRAQALVQEWHGTPAVITHCRQVEPGIGEKGDGATPAITHHAHLAEIGQRMLGGADSCQRAIEADLLYQLDRKSTRLNSSH